MDIHNREKRINLLWSRVRKNSTSANYKLLKKYETEMASRGLSVARIISYIEPIYMISRDSKQSLKKYTLNDIKKIVGNIEKLEISEYTKSKYKRGLKKFYQYVDGHDWNSKDYGERVNWIKSGTRKAKLSQPIILTKEEVIRLFKSAKGLRDKAMVSFMYESGCRSPDELLPMKISDIVFDKYGAKVKLTSGKVGTRTIRVVACVPHLKRWIKEGHPHPVKDNYVWLQENERNEPVTYDSLQRSVRTWRKRADIDKRITAYTFRRTRYTHLSTKIPTPALYKFMGQVQGSKVIDRYVSLDDEASDDAILNFYGIKNRENGDIKALYCSRCNKQNAPELEHCEICEAPLTEQAIVEADKKLLSDNQTMLITMVNKLVEEKMSKLK